MSDNQNLYIDFYGYTVIVTSDNDELITRLKSDFHFFIRNGIEGKPSFRLSATLKNDLAGLIPIGLTATKQSFNSITYNQGSVRYNDYYGEVTTIFHYDKEIAEAYGNNVNRLHEICYLLILSRQGKFHDRHGLHKIHAFGVTKQNKTLIGMLPMKGGKTTLFTHFLADKSFALVSDDSPLVDMQGSILPFPIRIGVEPDGRYNDILKTIDSESCYEINRKQYGKKVLVDICNVGSSVGQVGQETYIFQGIRRMGHDCEIKKCSKVGMFQHLMTNMIVGIGLPMIIEYFLETSPMDKFRNFNILCRRTLSALRLLTKAKCYVVYMGYDQEKNFKTIRDYFFSK
jgi:hypothetical protein